MLKFKIVNKILVLISLLFSSCSLFKKGTIDNFDCARYDISHNIKYARKNNSENNVTIQGVTRYCDDNSIAKSTIIRIVDENDKVVLHTISDDKGRYKLFWKSGAFKISALNPSGGIVETSLIDFGLYSMSTKVNLYMQHPRAFIEIMEDPRIKKN